MVNKSRTIWKWNAAVLVFALSAAARAEIGLEEPAIEEPRTPPTIVVPAPERTANINTNGFLAPPPGPVQPGAFGAWGPPQEPRQFAVRVFPVPAPVLPTLSVLALQNRETAAGELVGLIDGVFHWRHPLALEEMELRADAVAQLTFDHSPSTLSTNLGVVSVLLASGDEMFGRLLGVDGNIVRLDHPQVGELTIRRTAIARIVQSVPGARRVYVGPLCAGEWRAGSKGERTVPVEAGRLLLKGENAATCAAGLPRRVRVDFELEWGKYPTCNILVHANASEFTERGQTRSGQFMGSHIRIWSSMVQLEQMTTEHPFGGGFIRYEHMELAALDKPGRGRFTIFVSQPDRVVSLIMDGRQIKEWRGIDEIEDPGQGLGFSGDVKVDHIVVREWDGRTAEPLAAVPDQDALMLANFDKLNGVLKSVDGKNVVLGTAAGDMTIPVERVQEIAFATHAQETVAARPSDALILLNDGGRLRLGIEHFDARELTGLHPDLGRLCIPFSSIQQVRPGIHEN